MNYSSIFQQLLGVSPAKEATDQGVASGHTLRTLRYGTDLHISGPLPFPS